MKGLTLSQCCARAQDFQKSCDRANKRERNVLSVQVYGFTILCLKSCNLVCSDEKQPHGYNTTAVAWELSYQLKETSS